MRQDTYETFKLLRSGWDATRQTRHCKKAKVFLRDIGKSRSRTLFLGVVVKCSRSLRNPWITGTGRSHEHWHFEMSDSRSPDSPKQNGWRTSGKKTNRRLWGRILLVWTYLEVSAGNLSKVLNKGWGYSLVFYFNLTLCFIHLMKR